MICVEIDKDISQKMQEMANIWNDECKILPVSYIKREILSPNEFEYSARIIDFDFTRRMDDELKDRLLHTINKIQQNIFGIMIFNPYGLVSTKEENETLLKNLMSDLQLKFNILGGFRDTYLDNKMPMMHQTLVLERK